MEAHDGLSAAMAERASFKGLWASGLSIACSLGYVDANEASCQLADLVERIVDSTRLPVLVDGDGGSGNFNAPLLARKLHQPGTAGVALEDSCFSQDELICWRSTSARGSQRILRPSARGRMHWPKTSFL